MDLVTPVSQPGTPVGVVAHGGHSVSLSGIQRCPKPQEYWNFVS